MKAPVTMIRVDLPPRHPENKGSFGYFFISAKDGQRWHPWWTSLFEFLMKLERQPDGLHPNGGEMEIALMAGQERQSFLKLLQTAPASETARHLTLRIALRRLPSDDSDLPVRYFGSSPTPQEAT